MKNKTYQIRKLNTGDNISLEQLNSLKDKIDVTEWTDGRHGAKEVAFHLAGENIELLEPIDGKWILSAAEGGKLRVNYDIIADLKKLDELYITCMEGSSPVQKKQSVAVVRSVLPIIRQETIKKAKDRIGDQKLHIEI